jgi:hypothetical protein
MKNRMNIYFYFKFIMMLFLVVTHSVADVFDTIQDTNEVRTSKYNMPLSPTIDPKDPKDLSKLLPETTKIDQLLTKNINTKVHATQDQQKKALQAVFSTEIIYGKARPSYLKGINDVEDIYGHCYVLEYSTLFARDCIRQMSFGDTITLEYSVYKDLYRYSGLDEFKLFEWFMEMYNAHTPGISLRSRNVSFASTSLTRQYGMEYPYRKELMPMSAAEERNVSDATKTTLTREVNSSDATPALVQLKDMAFISHEGKLFDAVNNNWVERDTFAFMKAARSRNIDLLRLFVIHGDEEFPESRHLDTALKVSLSEGDLGLLRILMMKREGKTVSQEGLDHAMGRLCCENHLNVDDVLQIFLSPLAVINPTSKGMNTAVYSACMNGAVDVLQLLLSQSLPIKPTEQGIDDALLKIVNSHRSSSVDKEKMHDILNELFSPTAAIHPSQQGIDNAFLAAPGSYNITYIQYFIEYAKGVMPSPMIVEQALTKLGDNYISFWKCQADYPGLIPYIKPYLSGEIKKELERSEHIKVISTRANEVSEAAKKARNSKPIPWTEELYNEALKSLSGVGVRKIDSTKK